MPLPRSMGSRPGRRTAGTEAPRSRPLVTPGRRWAGRLRTADRSRAARPRRGAAGLRRPAPGPLGGIDPDAPPAGLGSPRPTRTRQPGPGARGARAVAVVTPADHRWGDERYGTAPARPGPATRRPDDAGRAAIRRTDGAVVGCRSRPEPRGRRRGRPPRSAADPAHGPAPATPAALGHHARGPSPACGRGPSEERWISWTARSAPRSTRRAGRRCSPAGRRRRARSASSTRTPGPGR